MTESFTIFPLDENLLNGNIEAASSPLKDISNIDKISCCNTLDENKYGKHLLLSLNVKFLN